MQEYSLFFALDKKRYIKSNFRSVLLSLIIGIIIIMINSVFTQAQLGNTAGVKITSPTIGQEVPVGELTISGISTDNATTDCTVYADINNLKPFQKAVATGPDGVNDYSTWTFTYTHQYHIITNGTNELTAKLSCFGNPTNITKWNSVNVTGENVTGQVALIKPEADIKITSPITGQEVPAGKLTITGTSTDDATTDCQVYVDLNDQKPFQNATATGPAGADDYSIWNYNYTRGYHLITEGVNELTAKLSCFGNPTNITKWNSVNVTGQVALIKPENNVPPFIFSMPPVG
jgi:predicted secreted protein